MCLWLISGIGQCIQLKILQNLGVSEEKNVGKNVGLSLWEFYHVELGAIVL